MKSIIGFLKKEPVLCIATLLAVISSFIIHPDRKYITYIDFRVLALLLCLMLVVAGLQKIGVFKILCRRLLLRTGNLRSLFYVLTGLCFLSSMFITNDVSLITFVPFAILVLTLTNQKKYYIPVIVFQTIAANLGSMATPIGNPQNLYLYSLADVSLPNFLLYMGKPAILALLLLFISGFIIPKTPLELLELDQDKSNIWIEKRKLIVYLILFVVCICTVIHVLPYQIMLIIVGVVLLVVDRQLFLEADYFLLLTFVAFFVFVGNIERISFIYECLKSIVTGNELVAGVLMSQVISNVPAAILLSGFTEDYKQLLMGVNLGGLGTLIASMASLISYKYYCRIEDSSSISKGKYLGVFTICNVAFLIVLLIFCI